MAAAPAIVTAAGQILVVEAAQQPAEQVALGGGVPHSRADHRVLRRAGHRISQTESAP